MDNTRIFRSHAGSERHERIHPHSKAGAHKNNIAPFQACRYFAPRSFLPLTQLLRSILTTRLSCTELTQLLARGIKIKRPAAYRDVREKCMRQQIIWVLFFYLSGAAFASAQTASTIPSIEAIIANMALARAENQAHFRSYIVTRDYELFGKERAQTKSQVTADISFVPPSTKNYTIQKAVGTSFGETIVRRMLKNEVEIAKDYISTDFSPDNYDFIFILEGKIGGQRCYVLKLLPRRKDKNLLQGKIWVDAGTYLPQRIEGEPVKPPSWWLRRLHIELSYGQVGGMWLQTALEATATVRILGPHTMVSHDVKYQLGDLIAAAHLQGQP
jgi:hypothetical protein